VAVNCGAIPENLLEAESFQLAGFHRLNLLQAGYFQVAKGGIAFGRDRDLPLAMQSAAAGDSGTKQSAG
jgi:transcriptional regulator of acetoin/glycerol metabolism